MTDPLSYDSITFTLEADSDGGGYQWNAHVAVYTSTDGFVSNAVKQGEVLQLDDDGTDSKSISLAGLGTQSDPTTFRLVYWDTAVSGSGDGYIRNDSIQVLGEVVPEPTTLALLGLAGVGLVMRRR